MKIAGAVLCFVIALANAREWKSLTPLVKPVIPKDLPDSKIVGGGETTAHKWPWQVALYIKMAEQPNMYFLCGGALISSEWVVSAAHCTEGASSIDVMAGAHNLKQPATSQKTITSTEFIMHEMWDSYTLNYDIVVIKLPEAFTLSPEIKPIGIYGGNIPEGKIVVATGWGRYSDQSTDTSDFLREVTVSVYSLLDCQMMYGMEDNKGLICIDTTGGKGTCKGDSGGCLNYLDEASGTYVLAGVTSFGALLCEGGSPAGFSSMEFYADWIREKTGIAPVS